MSNKRILLIGGDLRLEKMADSLAADGYEVKVYSDSDTLKGALADRDIVILGLPCSVDDRSVDAPRLENPILIKDLFQLMNKKQLLLGGRFSDYMKALADVYSVRWADYFLRPELEVANAIPTAEGAAQIAMEELPITLHGANCVVTGYGKVGSALAKVLSALGAKVTVCARKHADRALICANNMVAADFYSLRAAVSNADILFNTVPATVIDRGVLCALKKDALVIDLASKPGGVDFDAAKDLGIHVIWALSLPGKVAPVTAGRIIKETIYNIVNELGV